jgi:hypothetical protein
VLDGIAAYSTELRGRYKGRYPGAVRQDLQALLSVVASKCKNLKALAAHVGAEYEMLLLRRKLYDDFGEQPTWYHGEIYGVTVDKIRVRYYYDNTRH